MPSLVQWEKLNEFLLQCGAVHDPVNFCNNALKRVGKLVPYDQGRVYYLDERGKVCDEYLVGVKKRITRDYHSFYSTSDEGRYDASRLAREYARTLLPPEDGHDLGGRVELHGVSAIDWSKESHDSRFYREHLAPQGIRHSTGFALFDIDVRPRVVFCLDRTRVIGYSHDELVLLSLVVTHLDNMYRNFYVTLPRVKTNSVSIMTRETQLTEREVHVAALVKSGKSTKDIAQILGISRTTVYKHVSNIHRKLGVSCQSELIARLNELPLDDGTRVNAQV